MGSTIELELQARIAKLEYELAQGEGYQAKLEEDQSKVLTALDSNIQNMDYLKMHEGIIDVAHIKLMKQTINSLQILLVNSQRTIGDWKNAMDRQLKLLESFKKELETIKNAPSTVISFEERKNHVKRRNKKKDS